MKKIISILLISSAFICSAQNADDALRYSNIVPLGTAKFSSMAGAMGALGADFSAMTINPAGLAIYRTNQISFSPVWSKSKVKSKYEGNSTTATKSKLKLSNIGFVSVFPTGNETGCKSINFSAAYNQTGNLYRNATIIGHNNYSSLLDNEVVSFDNYRDDKNIFNQANLFIYDSISDAYYNDYEMAGGLYGSKQIKSIRSNGNIGEYNFALGANFNDAFYIGGSVNIIHINYEQTQKYTETPDEENGLDLVNFEYTEYFQTIGTGVNLKLGLIYWLNDNIRFGAAFHTPTIVDMNDDYYSDIESAVWCNDGKNDYISYTSPQRSGGTYDWHLTMPAKFIGSVALVSPKIGMLNVDCEVIDYSGATLEDEEGYDDDFDDVNDQISDIYKTAVNLRIGGELSLKALALRAGFGFYGSPYVSSHKNSSANKYVYSIGAGWRSQNAFIDLGYTLATYEENHFMYNYDGDDAIAKLKSNQGNIIFTLGFKF